jgi:putative sterol carrier protein
MKSDQLLQDLSAAIESLSQAERAGLVKKVNGVFEVHISAGSESIVYTLEFKNVGTVKKSSSESKPDAVLTLNDDVFADMVNGKLNGQKAFMAGKLKIKGNMMLATKLDTILKIKPQKVAEKSDAANSSSVDVPGFNSSPVFVQMAAVLGSASDSEKQGFVKSGNAIFQFDIKVTCHYA